MTLSSTAEVNSSTKVLYTIFGAKEGPVEELYVEGVARLRDANEEALAGTTFGAGSVSRIQPHPDNCVVMADFAPGGRQGRSIERQSGGQAWEPARRRTPRVFAPGRTM